MNWRGAREPACVLFIALFTRVVQLDNTPHLDEFYHVLAARSWLEDGTLRIADGVYTRSWLFTVLVAWFFHVFGESLIVARLPAAVAGSLLVLMLFLWVRREAGRAAAWISGLLLCLDPTVMHQSQLVRFYTVQSLLFWIGAAGIYALTERRVRGPLALGLCGVVAVSFALALHLQVTTLIGLAGIGLWVAIRCTMRSMASLPAQAGDARRRSYWLAGSAIVAGIAASVVVAAQTSLVHGLWASYRAAPLWAKPWENDLRWYYWWFADDYRALWCLAPLAVVMAAAARPTAVGFCTVVFGTALVVHSFAAAKHPRFISYAMPFLAAIWGIALAAAGPRLAALIRDVVALHLARFGRGTAGSIVAAALGLGILGFAAYSTPAFTTAFRMMFPAEDRRPFPAADWRAATPLLRELADPVDVLITSAGPKSLYYLKRLDVQLSVSRLADLSRTRASPEFSIDYRTGRPLISTPESLQRLMNCHRRGLVILERIHLGVEWHVPAPAMEYLAAHTERVPVPERWRLHVSRWDRPTAPVNGTCARLKATMAGHQRTRIGQVSEPSMSP